MGGTPAPARAGGAAGLSPPPSGRGPRACIPCWFPHCPGWPDPGLSLRFRLLTVRRHPGIWQHPLPTWGRVRPLTTHLGVGERHWDHGDTDVHRLTESPPLPRRLSRAEGGCWEGETRLLRIKVGLQFNPAQTAGAGTEDREGHRAGGSCDAFRSESERNCFSCDCQFPKTPGLPVLFLPFWRSHDPRQKDGLEDSGDSASRRAGKWDIPLPWTRPHPIQMWLGQEASPGLPWWRSG